MLQQIVGRGASARARVLLADDHPMILDALTRLLEPDFEVVGNARSGQAALDMASQIHPDLLILDISMPELDGLAVARQLRKRAPNIKILMLSFHLEESWVRSAFEAGASGYLCKTSVPLEIEAAVGEVLGGNLWISPAVSQGTFLAAARPKLKQPGGVDEPLTPRESEILDLLANSFSNKEIAQHLGVSVSTVRSHLNSTYAKVGVDSRVGLALYASQLRTVAV